MSAPAQPPTEGAEGAAPGGGPPGPPPNLTSNRRLQQTQAQVEEVVDIMRVNVDKVLERDQILSELDDRADALQAGASQFESSAAKLKRKYWWKNCKMMIMLGAICAIIVVVIVTPKKVEMEVREERRGEEREADARRRLPSGRDPPQLSVSRSAV
ncbi:vesicle-associated membrane protein 1 isoform X3 [Vicugna pacos]|uniref:Vesicle-associated membrane protein 1 isoform X3 n=1 Tax=Vicugna pacos TaxID=30538 RepID=A0ABM5CNU1_VICPA